MLGGMMNRVFLMIVAVAVGTLISASVLAKDKQMGTLIPEKASYRMDTYQKYQIVLSNFEYVLDEGVDNWRLLDGTKPFKGDCEDFAFAMQHLVAAGSVFAAMTHGGVNPGFVPDHAVFIYAGVVWDLNGDALGIAEYQAKYAQIMWRFGDMTPDLK
jgi:hypothetical protein